jgi:hypothetical protein|tara:strand:+ start:8190 stop:9074 length:885 start_codon:yes stop_codon:yes gene_type:complete
MAEGGSPNNMTRIFAQVLRASASHKVEQESQLLRPKGYTLPSNAVYLGDVMTALLANLSQPDTPHFPQPPGFNEQRWTLTTQSGPLGIRVESHAYWGFGLFNSGYLNVIELTGPYAQRMRLMFDLKASIGRNPWEFQHRNAAVKWLAKNDPTSTVEGNEARWREGLKAAHHEFEASIEVIEQRSKTVEKRMKAEKNSQEWVLEKAQVAFTSAQCDLDIARNALADENAPGLERALARVEAALIEADPSTGLLSSDFDASAPEELRLRTEANEAHATSFSDLEIVDLTSPGEEEE